MTPTQQTASQPIATRQAATHPTVARQTPTRLTARVLTFADATERKAYFRLRAAEASRAIVTSLRLSLGVSCEGHAQGIEHRIFRLMEECYDFGKESADDR